jgi:glycosyltransferase involved in cell wall biosynthesis
MYCPSLKDLPPSPDKRGWPWIEESAAMPPLMPDGSPWPRVSLVTPCFNSGEFLEESIRSVLLQGYPDLEYMIIDGGSSDGSVDIIRKYETWLTYWESKPDCGQSNAINKGLARCTGKYFNWHNADDILLPGSLRETVLGFSAHPQASYICRYRLLMDAAGQVTVKKNAPPLGKVDIKRSLIATCPGSQPGGLMLRELVVAAGGIDETLECAMDEELMLKLLIQTPGYYIEKPGIIFRVHTAQKSQTLTKARVREKFIISRRIFGMLPSTYGSFRSYKYDSLSFAHSHGAGLLTCAGYPFSAFWHRVMAFGYRALKRICRPAVEDVL